MCLIRFIGLSPSQSLGTLVVPGAQQWLLDVVNSPIIMPQADRGNNTQQEPRPWRAADQVPVTPGQALATLDKAPKRLLDRLIC